MTCLLHAARALLAGAALSLSTAAAQTTGGFQLPPDYFSRFGSLQAVVSNTEGYGVRYFPLPTPLDIRLTLVKAPTYLDAAVSLRTNDTTFAVGKFYNVPTLQVTHDPYKGMQFSGILRDGGLSDFSGGYAFTLWNDRVRVLNTAGLAFKGDLAAPYTRTEATVGYGQTFGKFNTYAYATGRYYLFPAQWLGQLSADFYAAVNVSPLPGLVLDASHFERFVTGEVIIPEFGVSRYEQSTATVTYRLPGGWPSPVFGLGGVRARAVRDWTNDYTYVYGDLFFRTDSLPTMVGPSIGYRFDPGGKTGILLVSLVAIVK